MTFARLVFPIPPIPKIAIRGVSWLKALSMSETSDSRPWKIFGPDGNSDSESELDRISGDYKFKDADVPVVITQNTSAYLWDLVGWWSLRQLDYIRTTPWMKYHPTKIQSSPELPDVSAVYILPSPWHQSRD
jgi:hypothetical protein